MHGTFAEMTETYCTYPDLFSLPPQLSPEFVWYIPNPDCRLTGSLLVTYNEQSAKSQKEPTQQWSAKIGVQKLVSQDLPTMHMSP